MSDIPSPGDEDGSSRMKGDPKPDTEERRVGGLLHKKILEIQEQYIDDPIRKLGVKGARGIEPTKASAIELDCNTNTPLFQIEGPGPENFRGYNSQNTYKLPPDDEHTERLGLIIQGMINDKEDKDFFVEVTSDGEIEGYLIEPAGNGKYNLTSLSVNVNAVEPFINGMYERNLAFRAEQRAKADKLSAPSSPPPDRAYTKRWRRRGRQ